MAKEIEVETIEELEELATKGDFKVAEPIVETILKNFNGTKKNFHVLSVLVKSTGDVYDITLHKQFFKEELQKYLPTYEKLELYEKCSEILKCIKQEDEVPKRKRAPRKPKQIHPDL
jgi:hypothetical protein